MMFKEVFSKILGGLYRCLALFLSASITRNRKLAMDQAIRKSPPIRDAERIWFHASSVGELESLWPLVQEWLAERIKNETEIILTVFSPSAANSVRKLKAEIESRCTVLYCGFSPLEGQWRSAIQSWRPQLFVTVKYEAWPELWMSLSEEKVPLFIIGARARNSLLWVKRFLNAFGVPIPRLYLGLAREDERAELSRLFPSAEIRMIGEPRWERVHSRLKTKNPQLQALISEWKDLPRPWGILGSAWPEDLEYFKNLRDHEKPPGTWFVVPHRLDPADLAAIRVFTDGIPEMKLVAQYGILSELYGHADWAYVGGGFTHGVHSTIEPAIPGLPVACGPKNAEKFVEIQQLAAQGQLTLIHSSEELAAWVRELPTLMGQRKKWSEQNLGYLGGVAKSMEWMESLLNPSNSSPTHVSFEAWKKS